jgi:hypothetical protein
MSLYYPELDESKTIEVFKLNLKLIQDRFSRMKRKIRIDHEGIEKFATMHFKFYDDSRWNGRQIRNACQTALALAEYETQQNDDSNEVDPSARVDLTVHQFEKVRNGYLEFTQYLSELYGTHTARRAQENALRVDDLDNGGNIFFTTEQIEQYYSNQSKQDTRPQQSSRGRQERQTGNQILQNQMQGVQDPNQSRRSAHARVQPIQNTSRSQGFSAHSQRPDQRQFGNIQNTDHEQSGSRDTSMTPVREPVPPQKDQYDLTKQQQFSKGRFRTDQDSNSTYSGFRDQSIPKVKSGDKKGKFFSPWKK